MRFKTIQGSLKRLSKPHKYIIDWEKESRSKLQFQVKQLLKKHWKSHVVFEEFPVAGTKMSLDFYNANKKIAIEVQGKQHTNYTPHFHGGNQANFLSQKRRDYHKKLFCEKNEIKLIEIHEGEDIGEKLIKSVLYR
ncbi:MAG: hypothetical protein CMO74_14455 [Verrucomicrobiales bacterium]|nr:hypothetical protein [Verrucomicrobiales bacterium]|tara:strand:- start:61731 stop:62138 length:408 start_codon:yes stop_codon:yes gene_type:complete